MSTPIRTAPTEPSLLERAAARQPFAPRPFAKVPADRRSETQSTAIVVPLASKRTDTAPAAEPASSVPPRRRAEIDWDRVRGAGLLDLAAAGTLLAEEFRAIKRPILLDAVGARGHAPAERGRMVMVASARPGDGKTFSAANLALSLAGEKDLRVLLIDADFPKADVPDLFGLPAGEGLLDALRDEEADAEGFVLDTDLAGFSVLPAGTAGSDDTELLSSARAARVLDALLAADPQRLIVWDTPPVLAASAAAVLARHVGQVLFVVRADRTSETDVKDALDMLGDDVRLHLMLNAVKFTAGGRRVGGYYGREERR